jgi:hypothetical protein
VSTIRNTIETTLQQAGLSGYMRQAEPVVAVLEEREEQIKDHLRAFAEGNGLAPGEVTALFVECGLEEERAPEPEVAATGGQSMEALIASVLEEVRSMKNRLDSASQQASRHGIRF